MLKSFFLDRKWFLWAWGGFTFIIGSLLAQTWIDVKINEWYKGFYDLLQKATERDVSEFFLGIPSLKTFCFQQIILFLL